MDALWIHCDILFQVLSGEDVAERRLKLSEPVDFRKIRLFYMYDIDLVGCESLSRDLRKCIRKVKVLDGK